MPERLPWELHVVYKVARVAGGGPYGIDDLLERICGQVKSEFGFSTVRVVRDDAARVDLVLLDAALQDRRAVVEDRRVAVPLLVEGRCMGYLLADRGGDPLGLSETDLHLLTALGVVAGVFIAKAEQYEELQRALEELRRVDELKDEFVSIASHELRAPIAVVHGICTTLYTHGQDIGEEQQYELRQALFAHSSRLRDLTEQLLDLSRLDAGRIRIAARPFRPRDVVEALVPPGWEVRVEIDPEEELVSDRHAFERVVGNLVGNALKYGAPPVVVRGSNGDGCFRVVVEDRGAGVPDEFVPHLFDRFTRSDDARRGTESGAGLGLAIAHDFAKAVGGRIEYEPAEPRGARFVFALPARLHQPAASDRDR